MTHCLQRVEEPLELIHSLKFGIFRVTDLSISTYTSEKRAGIARDRLGVTIFELSLYEMQY
jgi:hypothetical protein